MGPSRSSIVAMSAMMNTIGMSGIGAFAFWLHVHWFFGLVVLVGGILFLVWALRNLQGSKLKTLALWLVGIGVIGALVTAPFGALGFKWFMREFRGEVMVQGQMMEKMMQRMMEHDRGRKDKEHEEIRGMMEETREGADAL